MSLILCSTRHCPKRSQGIYGRSSKPSMNPGNFKSLVKFLSKHNDVVSKRLEEGPHNVTWSGDHIQNELVQVMAEAVLSNITAEVKEAGYFTIIADETKDISKSEQLSIILRYVYSGIVHERFVGNVHARKLDAGGLSQYVYSQNTFRHGYRHCLLCKSVL